MDPDPLVRGTDPRIRIRTKMSRIPNTGGNNCVKKNHTIYIFSNNASDVEYSQTIADKRLFIRFISRTIYGFSSNMLTRIHCSVLNLYYLDDPAKEVCGLLLLDKNALLGSEPGQVTGRGLAAGCGHLRPLPLL